MITLEEIKRLTDVHEPQRLPGYADMRELARFVITAMKVVGAARNLNSNSTEPDDVSTDDYGEMIRAKWRSLSQALTNYDKEVPL